ncbi:MAG: AraC family transcriptional regulator [Micropepsaceae bacterium]
MAEPTVSAGYVRALAEFAVSRGADADALFARAGIPAGGLNDPDARLPFALFKALMRAAKDLSGDDALALHFGAATPLVDMSIVGLIAHASATMGEAFEQTNRFARLVVEVDGHQSGPRFAIVRRADGVWIEDRRRNPDAFPELTESTWARFVSEVARNFNDRPYVQAVHVTHPMPAYAAAYRDILKAPVTFGSDWNALRIDPAWLDIRLAPANRYVFGVFSDRAEALLEKLETLTTVRGRVEALLIPILHTGDLGMQRIARRLGVSRPTLYRQLKGEGFSFETLLDELRHRMALHYLEGKKVSIAEAAYLTGFSDAGAFSRAFKRWTGSRPGRRASP